MKVTKNGIQFDAEQITGEAKNVPELGLVNVPVGAWIVSLNGSPVQCPSDEAFKMFYTTVTPTMKTNVTTDTGN